MEILAREAGTDKSTTHLAGLMAGEFLSGHNEDGYRLEGMYNFAIRTIVEMVKLFRNCPDPTAVPRLVGALREAFEELRDSAPEKTENSSAAQ